MMDYLVIRRYARAFFQLVEERHLLEAVEKEFLQLVALLERYPEITHLVLNPTISETEKEDFIEKILSPDISDRLICFVKTLIKKRRFRELPFIQKEFHRLYEIKKGIQEVLVETAVPLTEKNKERLREVLEKKLQRQIRLLTQIRPEIIGGMILRFNGTEINAGYQNHLQELKQRLLA